MEDTLITIFFIVIGIFSIWFGLFKMKLKKFLNDSFYEPFRIILPLNPKFNYWLMKGILLVGGVAVITAVI